MDYEDELNKRLESRFTPSAQLQPLFDVRSTGTRYTHFKTHDEPKRLDINTYTNYSQENVFNPGDRAPVDYFFNQPFGHNLWRYKNQIKRSMYLIRRVTFIIIIRMINTTLLPKSLCHLGKHYLKKFFFII